MDNENKQDAAEPSPASDGSVGEPVAWMQPNQRDLYVSDECDQWHTVPLYRSPTLTDAEREAIYTAAMACEDLGYKALPMSLRDIVRRLR